MNRYIIIGGPGIGDTIIELVAAKSLKTKDPNCAVDILFSSSTGADKLIPEILNYQKYVDNYYCVNKYNKWATIRVLLKLRGRYRYSFSCSTAFKSSARPALISKIIGAKSVIKEVKGKTGKIDIPIMIDEKIHIVEQYFKLLNGVNLFTPVDGIVLDNGKLNYFKLKNETGKSIVTICLGTNFTIFYKNGKPVYKNIKEWDITRWYEIAETLVAQGLYVVLIGGKKERESFIKTGKICNISDDIEILAGKTTIGQSLSILYQSKIVIGADTGMMHCAAALGKMTLTLFGGTDSRVWKPYSEMSYVITGDADCSPCYGKDYAISCNERKCLNVISVQKVILAINRLLNGSNN